MMIDYDDRPGIVRCGEHSDYGTITILFQVRTRVAGVAQARKWRLTKSLNLDENFKPYLEKTR